MSKNIEPENLSSIYNLHNRENTFLVLDLHQNEKNDLNLFLK